VQTVQMPMRLLPFVAMITAVAVTVLLAGLGQLRARRPLMAALVIVVAAQALTAIYVVVSNKPGVALTATVVHRDDIRVEEEPSPFSGPQEVVPYQFRVLGQPKGDQKVVAGVPSTLDSPLTSDAATIRGVAPVGARIATDVVDSPLVRISGDARVAGRDDNGRILIEVTRTDANRGFTATVRGQCALCLSTDGGPWQLRVGRLITLLSFALLLTACLVSLGRAAQRRRVVMRVSPGRRRGFASRSR
jgi:hypothetical protein